METIPNGFCQCGCGQKTNIAKQTCKRNGYVKDQPNRFINGHFRRLIPAVMRFGRWTILNPVENNKHNQRQFLCQCDCGTREIVSYPSLTSGNSKSCGCYRQDFMKTHGMYKTKIYAAWRNMLQRCENKHHKSYENYGGRGIAVCERWHIFENFLTDMGEPFHSELTLERIDNDKGYESGNCKWATRIEQNSNFRRNRFIECNNQIHTLSQWARILKIHKNTLAAWIHKSNGSLELAISTFKPDQAF
jgi:hypothetical protein